VTSWNSGYVTDVTYMPGYYRQQAPSLMALACLLGGVLCPLPGPDDPVSYLELGCGQGYGALLLAAANPRWRVTGIDFNPAHVATARAWAAEAGIDNVAFLEADLATLAEAEAARLIPEADFASLHGVWTWVPQAVQAGIVRLLHAKLRPGGAVHVSYNSLPGWAGAFGLQRLLRETGRRLAARSDRQAEEGIKFARALDEVEAGQLRGQPLTQSLLKRFGDMPISYLAHEYMNDAWAPCFHADLAAALAEAKLDWVASATLTENFPDLVMTEAQRSQYHRFDDPLARELVKDMCLARMLRHDVFVRGPRRIGPAVRDAALRETWLALVVPAEDMPYEIDIASGRAELNRGFYGPIVAAMDAGPRRVGELLELPGLEGRRSNPAELIGILVGLGFAEPVLRPGGNTDGSAQLFNRFAARRLLGAHQPGGSLGLASEVLGAGAAGSMIDMLVADRVREGEGEASIEDWLRRLSPAPEAEERVREALRTSLAKRMPLYRASGVI
jgi:SAM-dependent methyltransferase